MCNCAKSAAGCKKSAGAVKTCLRLAHEYTDVTITNQESEVLKNGKNISAQEAPEKKGTRLQKAYEDLQRQKGSQEKTP